MTDKKIPDGLLAQRKLWAVPFESYQAIQKQDLLEFLKALVGLEMISYEELKWHCKQGTRPYFNVRYDEFFSITLHKLEKCKMEFVPNTFGEFRNQNEFVAQKQIELWKQIRKLIEKTEMNWRKARRGVEKKRKGEG